MTRQERLQGLVLPWADEPIGRTARAELEGKRRARGLCAADGYPLRLRDVAHERVTLECPHCRATVDVPRSHRLYRRAIDVMERSA